ncbi:DUF3732 domain-containing protein [Enterococcus sp. BWT-B8]|uniref:DUF3732 domain-containing protein n=1 Tax=Enterococcus sp. BWT-B8 TaxID=2885157 RepID=UPI001E644A11|nr:DUF3732 domain-containing protein [Enterococcus sp. BWT-B8]MCB5953349.1 DUF3732 domain-containing protein [Enterococcus sp. BWT-B8]
MQIKAIILYGKNGKKRILPLKTGAVNIISGKSKTGKSVIGDIIDYCFGSSSCNIADGFVRDHVKWYGIQLIHEREYIFIARENPPYGQATTNRCCYLLGEKSIPDDLSVTTPITNDGLEEILSSKLGISENIFNPPENHSRSSTIAKIRHTLFYCIQGQDEIASQKTLFHRQAEDFIPQAIKDTLPYFLGIVTENSLALKSEKNQLNRKVNILKKSINEVELIEGNGFNKATELLEEAREVGLISNYSMSETLNYSQVRNALEEATKWNSVSISSTGMDRLSFLQSELQQIKTELDTTNIEIRDTEEFLGQVKGFGSEVDHQRNRLQSIGLFKHIDFDPKHCPLCSKEVEKQLPSSKDIKNSIISLDNKLESVSRERPQLRKHIDKLNISKQNFEEKIEVLQSEIIAIYRENKEAIRLKEINVRRGRVVGRISLWLESVVISEGIDNKREELNDLESRLEEIDELLSLDEMEDRKQSAINRISSMMSEWAKDLNLEHSEYPYRLDLNKLTVVVDRERPVPLQQLGSGSNWIGCHLIALFALHKFFQKNNRPVPSFLFLDQPSQVYFPPETKDQQVDSQELRKIYEFIFERIRELAPNMQVLVVDHADIDEPYFQDAIIEKWWDETKLVPMEWAVE